MQPRPLDLLRWMLHTYAMAQTDVIEPRALHRTRKFDPACTIVRKLGGARIAAEACGVSITSVYRWMWPEKPENGEAKGSGGLIPSRHQSAILKWSNQHRNGVTAHDFFAKVAVVEDED